MKIVCLKAEHGDAFIINCRKGKEHGVIVVDGGPTHSSRCIVRELREIGNIDMMILTHYDDDHIGGLLRYIGMHKNDNPFPVKKLVVNCASNIMLNDSKDISYRQAISLRNLLDDISKRQSDIKWCKNKSEGNEIHTAFADIVFLSPTEDTLKLNIDKMEKETECKNISSVRVINDIGQSMKVLSEIPTKSPSVNSDIVNMASLAFIIKDGQRSILMLGDAFPQNIECYLRRKGYSEKNKLEVDYIKLSHHGSRNNISCSLLDIIDCSNFIISTNGGKGKSCHPDRETIAKVLCHKERNPSNKVHLYFNYSRNVIEKRTGKLFSNEEMEQYNFDYTDDIRDLLCKS